MIIPWVKIVWISDLKGYGLFATRPIPKGTVTFVQDGLDIVISSEQLSGVDPKLQDYVEKYSYEDFLGNRVISWDLGKYMNHDDDANTLSTGYGFEIAVRDIEEGEEVTDDYRIFSTHHDLTFQNRNLSLEEISPWPEHLIKDWDVRCLAALKTIGTIEQPLQSFIAAEIWDESTALTKDDSKYRSVSESLPLRYKLLTEGLLQREN